MKLNSTTFRIQAIISLVLIFISTYLSLSQTQEWIGFTNWKNISCLVEEGEYLWVGTAHGGLVKLNKSTGEFIVYDKWNSELPHNWVTAIAIDGQGNKWIGTSGGGLAKFDGVKWTIYNTSNSGLPGNWVTAIAIDGQGNKWIGTVGGGLAIYREGGVILSVEDKEEFKENPQKFTLYQNYPNPFNPATTIEFEIPKRTNVKLVVYDFLGNEIETLIDRELEAGKYKLNFNSNGLPSGVYLYTLKTPKSIQTNKMLLIK
jgi:Predicted periplasmic ligand-binding sensor domain